MVLLFWPKFIKIITYMSTPEQLINQIRVATDYQTNKRILREKIQADLHFTHNGGLFKASQELISFLNCYESTELVIEDNYQNPIKVIREELLILAKQHYQMAMNAWHIQHEELKRVRKI
jgi:hypothetical protein